MNAQELLNELLRLQQTGVDLSELNVVVPFSRYTGEYFDDLEITPYSVEVAGSELVLR